MIDDKLTNFSVSTLHGVLQLNVFMDVAAAAAGTPILGTGASSVSFHIQIIPRDGVGKRSYLVGFKLLIMAGIINTAK